MREERVLKSSGIPAPATRWAVNYFQLRTDNVRQVIANSAMSALKNVKMCWSFGHI